ncbi:MAG TPA: prenyltransferase/squalene oxidase repeat-containing protein [Candidatus Dormibacteraeota bacterium]
MTWQLGTFSVLAVALAAGFAWYERRRPDARVVALVATLAAFAALGRIAFAALPNIKPTTDIVLISGYALGGAPGFMVGALAGLVSNFFFGQGPWTPWQMAAWGATGALGAGLATLTRERISRWPLAVVCGVTGSAFAAVQDFGDWVTFSDHSAAQLAVYVGKGSGFDLVHAAGCGLFALAFGPALLRSLQRFTARLAVTWRAPDLVVPAIIAIVVAVAILPAQARAATPAAYLLAAQNGDGGFPPTPGQASSQLFTCWAVMGLAADGVAPAQISHGGPSAITYLLGQSGSLSDAGSLERTILALRAGGASASSAGGRDLLSALERDIGRNGSVSDQVNLTAFAVLALRAAGAPVSGRTLRWLVRQQDHDGGFGFGTSGGASDVDDTGAVLEALAGDTARGAIRARARGVRFLRRLQNRDGGFPQQSGEPSNAQSTAFALQGLLAAGRDPGSLRFAALGYLGSSIAPDGHVRYSRSTSQTPVWVTAQALMALAGKPLPLAPVSAGGRPRAHVRKRVSKQRQRRAGHHLRPRHSRRPRVGASTPPALAQLTADAGAIAAIALGPAGLG